VKDEMHRSIEWKILPPSRPMQASMLSRSGVWLRS
jgi:hypothetical protein